MQTPTYCSSCEKLLASVVSKTDLTQEDILELTQPRRVLEFHFPVEIKGEKQIAHGYRIQYNDTLGPTKGGLRFHPSVDMAEVAELAFLMALKTSLVGLPYGGAKGGLSINPKELSHAELEHVSRAFMRELASFIGPDRDIPAPDVNTTPEIMGWMLSEYEEIMHEHTPAVITGKRIEDGGSEGRNEATGRGGYYIIREMMKNKNSRNTRVAIQGFGNVAQHAAALLHEDGYKIIAVSDSSTGLYNEGGFDIPSLIRFKEERKSFNEYEEAKQITNDELLELDVDILIPAALGGAITHENVKDIKAPVIIELANGPITPEADEVLEDRGVTVVPDILANAGGVIVSYFEWLQNLEGEHWDLEEVREKLETQILEAYNAVSTTAEEKKLPLRTTALYLAIKRIVEEAEK